MATPWTLSLSSWTLTFSNSTLLSPQISHFVYYVHAFLHLLCYFVPCHYFQTSQKDFLSVMAWHIADIQYIFVERIIVPIHLSPTHSPTLCGPVLTPITAPVGQRLPNYQIPWLVFSHYFTKPFFGVPVTLLPSFSNSLFPWTLYFLPVQLLFLHLFWGILTLKDSLQPSSWLICTFSLKKFHPLSMLLILKYLCPP